MVLTWPLEQEGSTGEDVKTVQYLVTAHGHPTGADGIFGPLTKAAVAAFQASHGLSADGIVGPQTWPQLIIQVQQGSNGDAVRAVQSQIHGRGDGAAQIAIDGNFGPVTNDAVRAFQTLLGLQVDGIVGPQTWNHLVNGYLAAPDPQTAAGDVFSAWETGNRDRAGKNATPAGVNQIFAQSFSPGDGWSFEGCQGAAGHTFCSWKRSNGHELRIGVINAVEGPYYVADQAQFT
jgi:peptidoglycan hydrolase-like protein with peptidoglycan-binding domain